MKKGIVPVQCLRVLGNDLKFPLRQQFHILRRNGNIHITIADLEQRNSNINITNADL